MLTTDITQLADLEQDLAEQYAMIKEDVDPQDVLDRGEKFTLDPLINMDFINKLHSETVTSSMPYLKITKYVEREGKGTIASFADKIVVE